MNNQSENTKQLLHESLSVSIVSTLFASLPNILANERNAALVALVAFTSSLFFALYLKLVFRRFLFSKPKKLYKKSPLSTIILHVAFSLSILIPIDLAAYYHGTFYNNMEIVNFVVISSLALLSIIDIIFFKSRFGYEALHDILEIPRIFRKD